MSTAAPKIPTSGYAPIPNSLIENQAYLTRAELALSLIVIRRGGHNSAVPVSDRNWQSWTGLSAREKSYAIAGLSKKGCLRVKGRGERSEYSFERSSWDSFVRTTPLETRSKTEGRRPNAVKARPGAMMHSECRGRGCAMLSAEAGNVQPVAQTSEGQESHRKGLSLVSVMPNVQPVAQIAGDAAEIVWAKTLGALRGIFPWIGLAFLVRLIAVVRVMFHDVTDSEMARAVAVAYHAKRSYQRSEGLFLLTVPDAVRALREIKPSDTSPPVDYRDGCAALVAGVLKAVRARGAPFAGLVPELEELADRVAGGAVADLEILETEMCRMEVKIADVAALSLPDCERAAIVERVAAEVSTMAKGLMPAVERENTKRRLESSRYLAAVGIPRLGLFYV